MRTKAFLAALTTSLFALTTAAIAQDTRPGGFFSLTAPNDEFNGGVRDIKKSIEELNKVLAAESMPLVEYKPTDLCYIGFYYQDDQGKFSSYALNAKTFPFRYIKIAEGTCTYDAAKREESCQSKTVSGSESFRTIYPRDNFTDAADASSPDKVLNYVSCDSEASNLRTFMREAGSTLGRADLYSIDSSSAAPFVRAMASNPQVFEAIKKHINEF